MVCNNSSLDRQSTIQSNQKPVSVGICWDRLELCGSAQAADVFRPRFASEETVLCLYVEHSTFDGYEVIYCCG